MCICRLLLLTLSSVEAGTVDMSLHWLWRSCCPRATRGVLLAILTEVANIMLHSVAQLNLFR